MSTRSAMHRRSNQNTTDKSTVYKQQIAMDVQYNSDDIRGIVSQRQCRIIGAIPNVVNNGTTLTIGCAYGHTHVTRVCHVVYGYECTLCSMLLAMHRFDKLITPAKTHFTDEDVLFEFKCRVRHRFACNKHMASRGCPSCVLLKFIAKTYNAGSLTVHTSCLHKSPHSLLRFHCDTITHDPHCNNAACVDRRVLSEYGCYGSMSCNNIIRCGQDFICSDRMMRNTPNIYPCVYQHKWTSGREIQIAHRLFEILFTDAFTDDAFDSAIEFTGYSKATRVAFTHARDKHPAKCIAKATAFCKLNDILFIVISAQAVTTREIAGEVIEKLEKAGEFEGDQPLSVDELVNMKKQFRISGRVHFVKE